MNTLSVAREGDKISLLIDGVAIEALFDPVEFVLPIRQDKLTHLYFFTCTCHCPGCAGWHLGFDVCYDAYRHVIRWECLDTDQLDVVNLSYFFDFESYVSAQQACKDMLYDIAGERELNPPILALEDDEDYDYRVLTFDNADQLTNEINHRIKWMEKYQ